MWTNQRPSAKAIDWRRRQATLCNQERIKRTRGDEERSPIASRVPVTRLQREFLYPEWMEGMKRLPCIPALSVIFVRARDALQRISGLLLTGRRPGSWSCPRTRPLLPALCFLKLQHLLKVSGYPCPLLHCLTCALSLVLSSFHLSPLGDGILCFLFTQGVSHMFVTTDAVLSSL